MLGGARPLYPTVVPDYATTVTALAPTRWYKMNAASGVTETDHGSLALNGTWTLAAGTLAQTGKLGAGEAVLFDDANTILDCPASADNNAAAFTVMALVKFISYGENGQGRIFDVFDQDFFCFSNSGTDVVLKATIQAVTTSALVIGTTLLPKQSWCWVAMTYDDAGDRLPHLYYCGPAGFVEVAYSGTPTAAAGARSTHATRHYLVGNNAGQARTFDGWYDEHLRFAAVLTPAQMNSIANASGVYKAPTFSLIVGGQSNASGRGTNNQVCALPNPIKAWNLNNKYEWEALADPIDNPFPNGVGGVYQTDTVSRDDDAAGSIWPLVASKYLFWRGRDLGVVPCALTSSSITAWQPNVNHQLRTTLYGSMIYRALQAGVASDANHTGVVVWWQGEQDAAASMSQANYTTYLNVVADTVFADLGCKLMPCKLQKCTGAITQSKVDTINAAISACWGVGNVLVGPDLSDMEADSADHLHLISDANLATVAARWWLALRAAFGW